MAPNPNLSIGWKTWSVIRQALTTNWYGVWKFLHRVILTSRATLICVIQTSATREIHNWYLLFNQQLWQLCAAMMSWVQRWLSWFFTKGFRAFCLTCRKKWNPSQNFLYSHSFMYLSGSTELIVELNSSLPHIIVTYDAFWFFAWFFALCTKVGYLWK